MSNEWGRLCLALVDAQFVHLTNMLAAVDLAEYREPSMLLRPREDKLELLRLPEDVVVLKWASHMVHRQILYTDDMLHKPPKPANPDLEFARVQNFTSDLKGLHVLCNILKVIHRAEHAGDNDTDWSLDKVPYLLRIYQCPEYLVEHLTHHMDNPSGDIMFCVLSFLFCEYTSLHPVTCPWDEARTSLDEAKRRWATVRQDWAELDTPFDVTRLVNFTPDTTHVSVVSMAKEALQNAVQMVQYACAARAANMQLWSCVQKRVHAKAIDVLLHRAHTGIPFQMANRRQVRERAIYTKVDALKLHAILGVDVLAEEPKLEAILSEHYEDVQRIFKYYAASDVGDACSMSLDEFYRFLKDCKLLSKALGLAFVKKIFDDLNHQDIDHDEDEEVEFGPTEFVEAIVCVADKRLAAHKGMSLSQRVKKCLLEYILANACRSSTDAFRQQMNSIECKTVFHVYQTTLEQIYRKYAGQMSLNVSGFLAFLEDYALVSDFLSIGDVNHVLKKIQQDTDDLGNEGNGGATNNGYSSTNTDLHAELTFTEFCEAMGAIALYYNRDIFVPVHKRLDELLTKLVTPPAEATIRKTSVSMGMA
ncbi:Aste57867_19344 [Aphanomyces stellatus]|uniref:Aste57867_19344 protein n=1 Tax=Aphanomyces stellatus TaxID=120398 RepID=A0A485LD32_9STRA|nr:hypothetical protein As57867_019280 [Aphanomyces stellatus]VFT96058.1 Aste57867_19344 [Aphanomyces stellatus]